MSWVDSNVITRTLNYGYNVDGNVTSTADRAASYGFGYDGLNRLTSLTQSQHSGLGVNAVAAKQVAFQYFDDGRGDKLALGGVRRPGAMAYT